MAIKKNIKEDAKKDTFRPTERVEIYNINYVLNGGKLEKLAKTTYKYGEGLSKLPLPKKSGLFRYFFGGWFTDESFTNRVYSISKEQRGDITLYAKWVKQSSISVSDK